MKHLERFHKLLNEEEIKKISNAKILVIGIGGVGGYAIESLARSGIKKLILVDPDLINKTNINRQICALNSTIGLKKIEVMQKRINDINNDIEIILIDKFITKDNIDLLFEEDIDYLIDACDTIETKKEIIMQCLNRNIKFISSMGTGNKLNPSKLEITDIFKTSYDPIAKIIRKFLKENNINKKIMVISSNEKPIKNNDKIIGSTSYMPAIAGLLCSSYVINDMLDN